MDLSKAKYIASYGTFDQLPNSTVPEIAFTGRSNVGKSSLLNAIFGRRALAKVSSKPGKTATINFFDCEGVNLVDLPGYGFAKVSRSELDRWADLIEGYFNSERDLRLAVALIDIRHEPSELDKTMVNFLYEIGAPFVIVLTKADKLSRQKCNNMRNRIVKCLQLNKEIPVVITSSENKSGIDDLKQIIFDSIE